MTKAETILADIIDRTFAVFSPRTALNRRLYRDRLGLTARSELYAAAKTTRMTGAWSIMNPNVNDIIGMSSPAIRSRIRQLMRDFPYLARAANVIVDYSVGRGIIFQSKAKSATGKIDKRRVQAIEDAIKWWMDEADAAGKLHYYEIMRLAKRQDLESGEFLLVKTYPKTPNRFLPYALQVYEADWLSGTHDNYGAGGIGMAANAGDKETRQGIEYEKLTGRVTGFWFRDPYYGGNEVYVPADQVIHGFDMMRPQQLRGVSPFAPGVLLAHDLSDYMDAEIDTAKMAAKYLAFVKTGDPTFRQSFSTTGTAADGTSQKIETMENAIIEYLRPGEEVQIASHNRPGQTFAPFVRLILTMLSITTGAPYELISGDYQGLNFSTARIVRNDFTQQLLPISMRHIRQFAMPSVRTAIDMAVLSGKLTLPGYSQDPRRYLESEWQPPGMEAVDPLREAKSQIEAISFGLKSPQEVARERGRDLEDIYEEIQTAQEMAKEMGLVFTAADKSEKSNPAAIMEEE
ncbi:MAG TPA: phage portal protein [Syntrophaceae bacterium]|nr:phage portal protein [Syntrophaceae bacterium]